MRDKKSVLIIGQLPPPYMGPSMATEILLKSSLKEEFDLIHCDTSDHRDITHLGRIDFLNVFLTTKHYLSLLILILSRRPDLVYMPLCQTTLGYYRDCGFILVAKLARRKLVCHLRGGNFRNWYSESSRLTQWIVGTVQRRIDGQIVLGERLRDLFRGLMPDSKIFVVPNGGDLVPSSQDNRDQARFQVLYLSNFIREKGILDTLAAIKDVYVQFPDIRLVAAGKASSGVAGDIRALIRTSPPLPVTVLGPIVGQKKRRLFSESDIFVFPTYYPPEGHPWVIVEAMAAGLPIITTDQGAITESVIDGVNGFIVEKRSPRQIAEKIKYLIEHPDVRKKMGEESRRLYLENFTEEKMVERLSFAFHRVLGY